MITIAYLIILLLWFTLGYWIYLLFVKWFIGHKDKDKLNLRYYLAPLFGLCFVILAIVVMEEKSITNYINDNIKANTRK